MCDEFMVMTTGSQPAAYVNTVRRRRGYVEIFVQTDKDVGVVGSMLRASNLDCFAAKQGAREICLMIKEGFNVVAQERQSKQGDWDGCNCFDCQLDTVAKSLQDLESFDTDWCAASDDMSLAHTQVADKWWGYAVDHCVEAVHNVLKQLG